MDQKEYNKQYYQANKVKMDKKASEWAKNHPDEIRAKNTAYYTAHRSEIIAKTRVLGKKHRQTPTYKLKMNGYRRKYYLTHKDQLKYKIIYVDGKRVAEHRYIMEQFLGRKLKSTEVVHHLDHNRLNNELSNLALMDHTAHSNHHHPIIHKLS